MIRIAEWLVVVTAVLVTLVDANQCCTGSCSGATATFTSGPTTYCCYGGGGSFNGGVCSCNTVQTSCTAGSGSCASCSGSGCTTGAFAAAGYTFPAGGTAGQLQCPAGQVGSITAFQVATTDGSTVTITVQDHNTGSGVVYSSVSSAGATSCYQFPAALPWISSSQNLYAMLGCTNGVSGSCYYNLKIQMACVDTHLTCAKTVTDIVPNPVHLNLYSLSCPSGCTSSAGAVYGGNGAPSAISWSYGAGSSVCRAAIHTGAIDDAGGVAYVQYSTYSGAAVGSTSNGVIGTSIASSPSGSIGVVTWMPSSWGQCSSGDCMLTQQRTIVCEASGTGATQIASACPNAQSSAVSSLPLTQKCTDPCEYQYRTGEWYACQCPAAPASGSSTAGTQTRDVVCIPYYQSVAQDAVNIRYCNATTVPADNQACQCGVSSGRAVEVQLTSVAVALSLGVALLLVQ